MLFRICSRFSSLMIGTVLNSVCLYLFIFHLSFSLQSQEICRTYPFHEHLLKTNSEYKKQFEYNEAQLFNLQKQKINTRAKMQLVMPVVIHLVVPPGSRIGQNNNLTDLQVLQGLDYLNDAFANQGSFNTNTGLDTEIRFCLAVRDPNGKPTNGITRTESLFVADTVPCSPYGTSSANDGLIKNLVNWNCRDYLNIWLVTDLYDTGFGCGLAGYAYFPGAPCTVDGVVQEARYWNSISGTRVTAHEVGHYLSLHHTFNGGCSNNDCMRDGDQVCDTPPDNSPSFAACNTNSCSTDSPDLPDDNTNYMDYTSCTPMHFTQGQKDRMIAALNSSRSTLLKSSACIPVADLDASILALDLPSPICDPLVCPKLVIKNTGKNSINSLSIQIQYNNNLPLSYNWNGLINQNQLATIQLDCSLLMVGTQSLKLWIQNVNSQLDQYSLNDSISTQFIIFPKPNLQVQKINGSHCISDGIARLNTQNGTPPFLYQMLPLQYTQNFPIFSLLSPRNYSAIVQDYNLCRDTISVNIPDSCTSNIPKNFVTNRDALYLGNDCYRLTDATYAQVGSVWYEQRINLQQSFDVVFDMNLGCLDGNGADGIAFVLQPVSTAIGSTGGGLGYAGVMPSVAVEFDTYQNCCNNTRVYSTVDANDPAQDHMAITTNGSVNHLSPNNLVGPVDIINGQNAEDCMFHSVRISWSAEQKKLDVYYDCKLKLSYTGDIVNTVFKGDPTVYFGFTGATGGSINVQQVCFKYISFLDKIADQTICKGSEIQIAADDDFVNYDWTPKIGLDKPNIRNPNFSPDTTTEYVVTMKDNCGFTVRDTVIINVIDFKLNIEAVYHDPCADSIHADLKINELPKITGALYSLDGIQFDSIHEFYNLGVGTQVIYIKIGNCIKSTLFTIKPVKHLQDSLISMNAVRCNQKGNIIVQAIYGFPPYEYYLDNLPQQKSGSFFNLDSGWHKLTIVDSLGCSLEKNYYISYLNSKLSLNIINSDLEISCKDTSTFIQLESNGTSPLYFYKLDALSENNHGEFIGMKTGIHTVYSYDQFGCSSDSLKFEIKNEIRHKKDSIQAKICKDEFFKVGNSVYRLAGNYVDSLLSFEACDSVVYTSLSYHPDFNLSSSHTICEGDFVQVGPSHYFTDGIYTDSLSSQYGCDSIITTTVNVLKRQRISIRQEICEGSFFTVGQNQYSRPGSYVDTIIDSRNCDSIVSLSLMVHPVFSVPNPQTICETETISVGPNSYSQTGKYIDTLLSRFGCDSIIFTDLIVNKRSYTQLRQEICDGERFTVGLHQYSKSGTYHDTLINAKRCDSIIQLDLLVNLHKQQTLRLSTCENEPVTINGEKYYRSGSFKQNLKSHQNCDSILTVELEVFDTNIVFQEYILCNGDSFMVGQRYYYLPGKYVDSLNTNHGCDSTVNTALKNGDDFYCDSLHCRLYIPTVFSPNQDGINDEFQFYSDVFDVQLLKIYDRWGGLMFQSNELSPRWNGLNFEGRQLNPGVYIFYIEGVCDSGKKLKKVGEVTLVR